MGRGNLGNRLLQVLNRLAGPDDLVELAWLGQLPPQTLVLEEQLPVLEDPLQLVRQIIEDDRLDQVVECPRLERLDRTFDRGVGGNDEHERVRLDLLQATQQVDAVPVWKLHVADRHLKIVLVSQGDRLGDGFDTFDGVPLAGKKLSQRVADHALVLDDEHGSRQGTGPAVGGAHRRCGRNGHELVMLGTTRAVPMQPHCHETATRNSWRTVSSILDGREPADQRPPASSPQAPLALNAAGELQSAGTSAPDRPFDLPRAAY